MDAEIGDEFHYILQCQSLENEIYIGAAVYQWYFLKKYSDSQCCWRKYSDFGGGKKK